MGYGSRLFFVCVCVSVASKSGEKEQYVAFKSKVPAFFKL